MADEHPSYCGCEACVNQWIGAPAGATPAPPRCALCGHAWSNHRDEVDGHSVACTYLDGVTGYCGCGLAVRANPPAPVADDLPARHQRRIGRDANENQIDGCVECGQSWPCDAIAMYERVSALTTAIEAATDGLDAYADPASYRAYVPSEQTCIDLGTRARETLAAVAWVRGAAVSPTPEPPEEGA